MNPKYNKLLPAIPTASLERQVVNKSNLGDVCDFAFPTGPLVAVGGQLRDLDRVQEQYTEQEDASWSKPPHISVGSGG